MEWIFAHWLWFAISFSMFWGFYGIKEDKEEVKNNWKNCLWIKRLGIFVSEFMGSFAGWYCLYILAPRLQFPNNLTNFDIFLGTIAVIGISGYSYKLVDAIDKKSD